MENPSKINHEHVGKFIPDTVRPHGIRWMGSWNKKKIKKTSQSRISDHLFLVVSPKLQHQGGFLCTPKRTPPVGSMFFFLTKKHPTNHKVTTLNSRRPQFGFRRAVWALFFLWAKHDRLPRSGTGTGLPSVRWRLTAFGSGNFEG